MTRLINSVLSSKENTLLKIQFASVINMYLILLFVAKSYKHVLNSFICGKKNETDTYKDLEVWWYCVWYRGCSVAG